MSSRETTTIDELVQRYSSRRGNYRYHTQEAPPEVRRMTSFGLDDGEVEVFPAQVYKVRDEENSTRSHDSESVAVSESIDADEFSVDRLPPNMIDDDLSTGGRRGRKAIRIALLCTLVAAIVLGTLLSRNNRQERLQPGIVAGAEVEDNAVPPTLAPTTSLETTAEYQILKPYVNPPSKLLDPETPQGKAFAQIVNEGIDEDAEFRVKQRFSMMAVFFSTGGEAWSWKAGWTGFSENECEWYGVSICRFRNGRRVAAGLQIPSNNAIGSIPEEICLLQDLESILLENNRLVGSLPACITELSSVFEFNAHGNELSGAPPSGFLDMPNLESLDLSSNQFSGSLDFLVGPGAGPSKLTTLKLDDNDFDGDISTEVLGQLGGIQEMTLHDTGITGDVSTLCSILSAGSVTATCDQLSCTGDCCNCV